MTTLGTTVKQITNFLFEEVLCIQKTLTTDELCGIVQEKFNIESIKFNRTIFDALIHTSFQHEFAHKFHLVNNEKLEFLGDTVLSLVVTEKIYQDLIDLNEGEMSKLRSSIVNEETLSLLAKHIGLGKLILLGKGELKEKGFEKDSILADTFEAVLGAMYIEQGLEEAKAFLLQTINRFEVKNKRSLFSKDIISQFDAKSKLQELIMKKYKVTPHYASEELLVKGQKIFKVTLKIKNTEIYTTELSSKKKAMQLIAHKVLTENILDKYEEKLCY